MCNSFSLSLSSYIVDEPSLLIDFSSIFMNKDNPSDYSFCFAFLPTIIKVLQLSSSSSSSSNAFVYREIDYLYDKVTSYCMNNLKPYLYSKESIPSIEQYCHALAEANYYYYSSIYINHKSFTRFTFLPSYCI